MCRCRSDAPSAGPSAASVRVEKHAPGASSRVGFDDEDAPSVSPSVISTPDESMTGARRSLEDKDDGKPIVHLHQRFANEDISPHPHAVNVRDTSNATDFFIYPEFHKKRITLLFDPETAPSFPGVSISFKFQPDDGIGNTNVLLSSPGFFEVREGGADGGLVSSFFNEGDVLSVLHNALSVPKQYSGNHYAALLSKDRHVTYLNGLPVEANVTYCSLPRSRMQKLTIGPYPGKIWDVKIYDRRMTDSEIHEESRWFTDDVYKPDLAPDPDLPNGLAGVYRSEWWPLDEDYEEGEERIPLSTYQYYLYAQERAEKYYIFKAYMLPLGREGEFLGHEPRPLLLTQGIRKGFVRSFTFKKPQTYQNSDYWLHENFHSYQGVLKNFLGHGQPKWFLEATASWGPDLLFPGSYDTLMAYYTLAPHMPLWINQNGPVDDLAGHQYKGGHQYGAGAFLYHLTSQVSSPDLIGRAFNSRLSAQEAMFDILGTDPLQNRPLFATSLADFGARAMTWDYGPIVGPRLKKAEEGGLQRLQNALGLSVEELDVRFPATYGPGGTGDVWTDVPSTHSPGAYGYNAYRCDNVVKGMYVFEFRGDSPALAEFSRYEIRAVVHDPVTNTRTYFDGVGGIGDGMEVRIDGIVTGAGDVLYIIVAATPDNVWWDQTSRFFYRYKIYSVVS